MGALGVIFKKYIQLNEMLNKRLNKGEKIMDFKKMEYKRPNIELAQETFQGFIGKIENANSLEEASEALKDINTLRNEIDSMCAIVTIRNTIDTTDKFYEDEQAYLDEKLPIYEGIISNCYKAMIGCKYKEGLKVIFKPQLFNIANLAVKTISPEVIDDMQVQNKLVTEYTKLIASAKIDFEGEERNLPGMGPFTQSKDREVRKKATTATSNFYVENEDKFDEIFDGLVKSRTAMARKLGYENFIQLGYDKLNRTDYTPEMVANFRRQVKENIVPLYKELRKRQSKRLGIENMKFYDENLEFLTGNATPKGDSQWIIDQAKKMYSELSPETNEFFNFMIDNNLMDLINKKGKAGGGYCHFIGKYKTPFIFSNFNGTSGDVDVLTHEAGHAFQAYSSRAYDVPEYSFPTYEASEIHSMSMEFITWPWMELLFGEDADKYKFSHLSSAILFIPYGVAIDEFQHFAYGNPDATPTERKSEWRRIEKEYLPCKDYDGVDIYERGAFWFKQSHIFQTPFYYIDYTLAQICALQFWIKSNENREASWEDYLALCKKGGSESFLELVDVAKLNSPFEDGCISKVITEVQAWLDKVDDTKL